MIQQLMTILALATFFVASGCQTYTSGLQQSLDRAHETVAMTALHNIALAEKTYSVSHEDEYGTLAQLAEGGYLDSRFSSGKPVADYVLTLTVNPKTTETPEASYSCAADPQPGRPGRHFYIDSTSVEIHVNATQAASASDPTTIE